MLRGPSHHTHWIKKQLVGRFMWDASCVVKLNRLSSLVPCFCDSQELAACLSCLWPQKNQNAFYQFSNTQVWMQFWRSFQYSGSFFLSQQGSRLVHIYIEPCCIVCSIANCTSCTNNSTFFNLECLLWWANFFRTKDTHVQNDSPRIAILCKKILCRERR